MSIKGENNISDSNNYKKTFEKENCIEYNKYYVKLICNFLDHFSEHIILQNSNFYYFVIQRGILSISHIFNILLLYTKNIKLTLAHCNKALYYFIEFIGQIVDDNHSYLQLNSKDATLFIYKKTIFDLDNDFRKNYSLSNTDNIFMNTLMNMNTICNELTLFILKNKPFDVKKKEIIIQYTIKNIIKLMNHINNSTYEKLTNSTSLQLYFIQTFQHEKMDINSFVLIVEAFLKKIKKNKINIDTLQSKFYHPKNTLFYTHYTPLKYINWLFSD